MSNNSTADLATYSAIDVHGHYGNCLRAGDSAVVRNQLSSADGAEVARRARALHIEWTFVSPFTAILPRLHGNAIEGNVEADSIVQNTPGLKQYVVIDPRQEETYRQAEQMLTRLHCVGIKIHPEEHGYLITEHAAAIFEFAARHQAIILTHSSEQNSQALDFVPWANRFPEVKLILAHIGCGWDGDVTHQIRAIQQCQHDNVYADTSSVNSIVPGLIELAVQEIGVQRILFAVQLYVVLQILKFFFTCGTPVHSIIEKF